MITEKTTDCLVSLPEVNNYFFAVDDTGITKLDRILKSLPAHANVQCLVEVNSMNDHVDFVTDSNIEIRWVHNICPEFVGMLPYEARKLSLPIDSEDAYACITCEESSVKGLQEYLCEELSWKKENVCTTVNWVADVFQNDHTELVC